MQMQGVPEGYIERNVTVASVLLVIAMGIVGLAVYLLPLLVGRRRRKAGTIAWVNVLLGWTVIGWVVAMVWAMGDDDRTEQ
jgi:uncharacterized membrane protein YqaE (UPF0057 family)